MSSSAEEMSEEGGRERNKTSIYSPYISPVYGDLLGLPPLMITGGDVEPLWEDIRAVHKKAVEQGVGTSSSSIIVLVVLVVVLIRLIADMMVVVVMWWWRRRYQMWSCTWGII
jgi:hypothetical protein